jgi:hypothetical protein
MALPNRKIKEIIASIDQLIQPKDQRYGRLLNWQNLGDPFWHYGIVDTAFSSLVDNYSVS